MTADRVPMEGVGARDRKRLARSMVWMLVATRAERWADEVTDSDPHTRPFSEWPDDEPMRVLARELRLTPAQLAVAVREVAQAAEDKALAAGYDDLPDEVVHG